MSQSDETAEKDGTDPNIGLPPEERTQEIQLPDNLDDVREGDETVRGVVFDTDLPPPPPSPVPRMKIPPARLGRTMRAREHAPKTQRASSLSSRTKTLPESPRAGRGRTLPFESQPPAPMPKPSDPAPPARTDLSPPQRQRFRQMETELDAARASLARQRHELDELRGALDQRQTQIDELLEGLPNLKSQTELVERVAAIDYGRAELEEKLRRKFADADIDATEIGVQLSSLDARVSALEERTEIARVRMRLERVGHRLDALDTSARAIDEGRLLARVERMESLFDELAADFRKQHDTGSVEARLATMEDLVVDAGTSMAQQTERLEKLETLAPPPMRIDDLTQLRGIGPKFARRLADLGITTYAAIAAWDDEDMENFAEKLGINPSRIKKSGWVEDARSRLLSL